MSELLRGGRLAGSRRDIIEFTSSIKSDVKLLRHVVNINRAHIIMLVENKIVRAEEGSKILGALMGLEDRLTIRPDIEDVHMLVEEEVIRCVGMDVGGNLNLAKSRNDQVVTAIRMALREELLDIMELIVSLQETLINMAERSTNIIIPGYTHLQPAQPTTLAHYLLAQSDILGRSLDRLLNAYGRVNLCPMGAGALATTSFPISRERVAELLGFDGLVENSIDAVSSRDFLLEVLAALSIMAIDLSRLAEDLILWSSVEFNLIELPDEFTSTSSIMPQKKNPEVLEIVRAKMSSILGDFTAASAILKGLPSTYNLDFQEATPKLWDACEIIRESLRILPELIRSIRVREEALKKPILSFLAATELANILVKNYGVPFRLSHKIVGALVKALVDEGKPLSDATPEMLARISEGILGSPINIRSEELQKAMDLTCFVESHSVRGGPSRGEVERMISARRALLSRYRSNIASLRKRIEDSINALNAIAESYAAQAFHPASKEP
ncbi:MAG: argininosuccinate lyase [Candidatus Bathyarchaeia archaeon]|nr:argininosuccinate lyase [Candidatus Bathyarchaeota archaeon]